MTRRQKETLVNYGFIAPAIIGIFAFRLGPMVASAILSFTSYDILTSPYFIGLSNYARMLDDALYQRVLFNTSYYVVATLPLRLLIALLAAVLLNNRIRGIGIFRTIFYLPTVSAGVAVSLLWQLMYEPRFGLINSLLGLFGISGPAWLGDPAWSMPAIILMMSLNIGQFMLVFLGGLQGIPDQLYEAVKLDGGSSWHQFRFVTIPFLTPVIFLNSVIGIIGMAQMFTQVYVMTEGGPLDSTLVYVLYIYQSAFVWLEMGYASAISWVLFAILLALTLIQFRLSDRWVYYESSGGK